MKMKTIKLVGKKKFNSAALILDKQANLKQSY